MGAVERRKMSLTVRGVSGLVDFVAFSLALNSYEK